MTRSSGISRFGLDVQLTPEHTVVGIIEQPTGTCFQRRISCQYYRHLRSIQWESAERTERGRWLRSVLDEFAQELVQLAEDPDSSWRARTLNSVLVRRFYEIKEEDPKVIQNRAALELDSSSRSLRVEEWKAFYLQLDVINAAFDNNWAPVGSGASTSNIVQGGVIFVLQLLNTDQSHMKDQ